MTPLIFDRALLSARRRRAARAGAETFLLDHVAADLAERVGVVTRCFARAADIGTATSAVRDRLIAGGQATHIVAVTPDGARPTPAQQQVSCVIGDEERLPLREETFDLAVSALSLQWVNDLPGALAQINHALKPDGLLLAALLGGETLTELRQAFAQAEAEREGGVSPRVAPFADLRDLGALLQRAHFALPVTDTDRLTVRYASAFALMQDLRHMGATNILHERRRTPLRRATLLRMAEIYAEKFSDPDGRIRATFDVQWLSGWKPHESQQKPLAPGSAKARLADALGATETSAGEKAGR